MRDFTVWVSYGRWWKNWGIRYCLLHLIHLSSIRKEKGCLSYHLYQNTQQPNQVSFIELWQNQAVLDTHSASAHFTRIVPTLVEACEKAPVIQLYTQIK